MITATASFAVALVAVVALVTSAAAPVAGAGTTSSSSTDGGTTVTSSGGGGGTTTSSSEPTTTSGPTTTPPPTTVPPPTTLPPPTNCVPGVITPGVRCPQKITWVVPAVRNETHKSGTTFDAIAVSDSTLDVTVVASQACTGTGVTNTGKSTPIVAGPLPAGATDGVCTLTASQAGNDNFLAAADVTIGVAIGSANACTPSSTDPACPQEYVPVTPKRVLETRTDDGGGVGGCNPNCQTDNWKGKARPVGGGDPVHLKISGFPSDTPVAADASAVVVNVTAVDPDAAGFVTVWDCDDARPLASSVNLKARSDSLNAVPNAVIAKLSATGEICLFTTQTTDLVVDIAGWFPKVSTFNSFSPKRVLETRPEPAINYTGTGAPAGGTVLHVPMKDAAGNTVVPAGSKAVAVNVTAIEAASAGTLTVWDCKGSAPSTTNLTLIPNSTIPNLVLASLDTTAAASEICILTSAATDLVVDVAGFFPSIAAYTALGGGAQLLLDTSTTSKPGADGIVVFDVKGKVGIGANATAVVLTVTGKDATFPGFVTVWPDPTSVCAASTRPNEIGRAHV